MRNGADFGGDRRFEAALAENAVSQFPPRQGPGHRLGERVMMRPALFTNPLSMRMSSKRRPQPDDFLANRAMTLRRQCSARKALVPKIGAMHIGQR